TLLLQWRAALEQSCSRHCVRLAVSDLSMSKSARSRDASICRTSSPSRRRTGPHGFGSVTIGFRNASTTKINYLVCADPCGELAHRYCGSTTGATWCLQTCNGATMQLEVAQALSLKATATVLSISPRTVHRLIDEKGLPSIRIGRRRLVRRDDLRAWLM